MLTHNCPPDFSATGRRIRNSPNIQAQISRYTRHRNRRRSEPNLSQLHEVYFLAANFGVDQRSLVPSPRSAQHCVPLSNKNTSKLPTRSSEPLPRMGARGVRERRNPIGPDGRCTVPHWDSVKGTTRYRKVLPKDRKRAPVSAKTDGNCARQQKSARCKWLRALEPPDEAATHSQDRSAALRPKCPRRRTAQPPRTRPVHPTQAAHDRPRPDTA